MTRSNWLALAGVAAYVCSMVAVNAYVHRRGVMRWAKWLRADAAPVVPEATDATERALAAWNRLESTPVAGNPHNRGSSAAGAGA